MKHRNVDAGSLYEALRAAPTEAEKVEKAEKAVKRAHMIFVVLGVSGWALLCWLVSAVLR